jgi:HlyD family secretion protein
MKPKQRIAIAAAVLVVVALIVSITLWQRAATVDAVAASGTVEATEADLGFQLAGRIDSILVREGDSVTSGQELAWLDRTELLARRHQVEAQLATARARLTELERGFRSEEVAQGRAALRAAEQRLADAQRDYQRVQHLFAGGAVSQQQLDDAQTALTVAQADHDRASEQLQILEQGPRSEQIAAQRAVLAQARASVAQLDASLANAVVRAPFDGIVTVRHREPGEIVGAGAPALTVMNPDDRWIRIYVRGDEVGRLGLGLAAEITADAYADRTYAGAVSFIASEAEFTPRNVQTTAERVKLVYRVKVRVTGDATFDLKPGLPADVRIDTSPR